MCFDGARLTMERLADHVDLLTGFPFKSESYTTDGSGTRLVRGDNVIQGQLRWDNAARWPVDEQNGIERYELEPGDVVLAMDRPWIEAGLKYARIGRDDVPALLVQRVARLRAHSDLHQGFLFYLIGSRSFTDHVLAVQTGTAVPHISGKQILEFQFRLPPHAEQEAIASVLGALDDKIEQNRRTAQALERLARAIFRAWFVDFEPVKAKAAGATAFPSMPQSVFDALPTRFVDSAIGPVPEGWEVKAATDVASVAIGKTPPRKEPQWFTDDPSQVPWVSIRDMGTCGVFIGTTSEYLTNEAVERFRIRRIPDRSVLFSFKLTLGRVTIADGEITSNEAIAHFIAGSPDSVGMEYLYCYLIEFDHSQLGSTSSIATATNSKIVKEMPVLVPASSAAEAFTELTRPLFDALRSLARESSKLAEMRDYLLPKLLSGAVRVNEPKRFADEVV
jgi:type I restriction enzyme S subunit